MKNNIVLLFLFSGIFYFTTTNPQATEPATNPKQHEVENCQFLNDMVVDTTKLANKETNLRKKQELDKKIAIWKTQLEAGHCKTTTNELSCREIQALIDAAETFNKTARYTAEGWKKEQEKLDYLKEHLKNCK